MSTPGAGRPLTDATGHDATHTVDQVLRSYEDRGLFQRVGDPVLTRRGVAYAIVWNGRPLQMVLNDKRRTLAFPNLLPAIPADSELHRNLFRFVRTLRSAKRPAHRRVEAAKAALSCRNDRGAVVVTIQARDGDFDYATRQILSVAHEIITDFLADALYSDYEYEQFGVSPWV